MYSKNINYHENQCSEHSSILAQEHFAPEVGLGPHKVTVPCVQHSHVAVSVHVVLNAAENVYPAIALGRGHPIMIL